MQGPVESVAVAVVVVVADGLGPGPVFVVANVIDG